MTEQVYGDDGVYAVSPDAPIDEVAAVRSELKYGSAAVLRDGVPEGIFTTVDACRALADVLERTAA